MSQSGDFDEANYYELGENPPDSAQVEAREFLRAFFEERRDEVFFSRQIEVQNEAQYFHWITNRALRELVGLGLLRSERRQLKSGGSINLIWHRSNRYYKRSAVRLIGLVEEYSDPNIGAALGLHGETMVLEGVARCQFVMRDRNSNTYGGNQWNASNHNLDFIFERDSVGYGIEVKNTLGYMEHDEFSIKIGLAQFLGLRPVFAVRMLPKVWTKELIDAGGFALILKYQLYPWTHHELAKRVAKELGLAVDAPRALYDGTMRRFLKWHEHQL